MVPSLFLPGEWLAAIHNSPRLFAIGMMILAVSMLAFGLRAQRFYLLLGVGSAGWVIGTVLAKLMYVTPWYVALPATLISIVLAWPEKVTRWALPLCVGFVVGCGVGSSLTYGLGVANFWVGFGGAGLFGLAMALLAPRFIAALFFAGLGALGFVGSLGAVLQAPSGLFSRGAYLEQPFVFSVVGVILLVGSIIAQVAFEPESRV